MILHKSLLGATAPLFHVDDQNPNSPSHSHMSQTAPASPVAAPNDEGDSGAATELGTGGEQDTDFGDNTNEAPSSGNEPASSSAQGGGEPNDRVGSGSGDSDDGGSGASDGQGDSPPNP